MGPCPCGAGRGGVSVSGGLEVIQWGRVPVGAAHMGQVVFLPAPRVWALGGVSGVSSEEEGWRCLPWTEGRGDGRHLAP